MCSGTLWRGHGVKNVAISHSVVVGAHIGAEKLIVAPNVLSNGWNYVITCLNGVLT